MPDRNTISIPQLAQRLRTRYQRARDLVLCGDIEGHQDAAGRWHVSVVSVDAWLARHEAHEPKAAA